MSANSIWILGNLGGDPEQRTTRGGDNVTSFSVATTENVQGQKLTSWFRCSAWGKTGDLVMEHFKKGDQILVQGPVRIREYESNGEKRTSVDVKVEKFTFAGGNKKEEHSGGGYGSNSRTSNASQYDSERDEIPF